MHAQLPMVAKIPYDHPMVTELGKNYMTFKKNLGFIFCPHFFPFGFFVFGYTFTTIA
jgi:hypothetical protein